MEQSHYCYVLQLCLICCVVKNALSSYGNILICNKILLNFSLWNKRLTLLHNFKTFLSNVIHWETYCLHIGLQMWVVAFAPFSNIHLFRVVFLLFCKSSIHSCSTFISALVSTSSYGKYLTLFGCLKLHCVH